GWRSGSWQVSFRKEQRERPEQPGILAFRTQREFHVQWPGVCADRDALHNLNASIGLVLRWISKQSTFVFICAAGHFFAHMHNALQHTLHGCVCANNGMANSLPLFETFAALVVTRVEAVHCRK
ncbi:MAG TPA: hypothetical protein VFY22_09970, partial [Hydrogenophaga sp.]|nr:hypothetical protein [Hydrogenophaga sp.]